MKKIFDIPHWLTIGVALFLTHSVSFAQVEYLVKVDPSSCSYSILDSIPIIKWIATGSSTYDKINKRFVFVGLDNGSGKYLCSVDATNGSTVSIPTMTSNFGGLKFDNSTGILYGVRWTSTLANGADFVQINPSTLTYTVVAPIQLSGIGSDVTFDDLNHRYILLAFDSLGTQCLFSIDVFTGNVISKPTVSGVNGLQYENSTGNVYALHWDNNSQTEYLATVNLSNGGITLINSIPNINGIAMGYPTFDEVNRRYTFRGLDNSGSYIVTLDVITGQVVYNPNYPSFTTPYNLVETEYDNSTGYLYALHWGPYGQTAVTESQSDPFSVWIYPNPVEYQFNVIANFQSPVNLEIRRVDGTLVLYKENLREPSVDASNISPGIYIMTIHDGYHLHRKTIIITR